MKIAVERLEQVNRLAATQQDPSARNKVAVSEQSASDKNKDASLQVTLSKRISNINTDTTHDVNLENVNKIKMQISEGKYLIDTDEIAQQLVSDIFNLSKTY